MTDTDYANEEWLTVLVIEDEGQAEVIEGFLRSEGLPCQVESKYSHEFPTHVGHLAQIELKVPESRAAEAKRLIETRETAAGEETVEEAAESAPAPAAPGERPPSET